MITNIRGTSGSGKTTVIKRILDSSACAVTTVFGPDEDTVHAKVLGYTVSKGDVQLRVVGRYATPCGGCDGIKTQQETEDRVRLWHAQGYHVVFEGLLISTIYGRWAKLAKETGMRTLFLDTPEEECVQRVINRRSERGVEKPLNETNTRTKWHLMGHLYQRFKADGLYAELVNMNTITFESLTKE